MAGEGTPIGALAVRIGADASDLIKGLAEGGKAVDGLNKKVGDLTDIFKGFAGALSIGAMVAYVKNAADMADQAGKLAQKVGMSVEAFSALKYAASIADVGVEQLSVGLRQLSKNMLEASNGTGDAKDAFKALGVEVGSGFGTQLRGTEETLLAIAEKFAKMEDGAGKTAIAMKLFGRSGAELIPFLNQGKDGIAALTKEAQRLGVVISGEAAARAEEFNDNLRRLKASSEGLAIALTSNLVEGLGKATAEMLKARSAGESFAAQLRAAIVQLTTGDDLYRWNKEFFEAVETLDIAQRKLIATKAAAMSDNGKMWPEQAAAAVAKMSAEVAKAEANVKRLQAIKGTLLGDKADEPPPPPKKVEAPHIVTDEERRREQEVRDAMHKARVDDDARELTQIEFQNKRKEELRLAGLAAEQDIAEKSARMIMHPVEEENQSVNPERDKKLVALQQYAKGAAAIENERYKASIAGLNEFSQQELNAIGGRQAIERRLEEDHQASLEQIRQAELARKRSARDSELNDAETFFGAMEGLMNTSSRKLFEIGKAGAIANTIVKTYSAAMNAWEQMSSIGPYGWVLGAAAAGAIIAAGMANVQKIASTSFGSRSMPGGTFNVNPNTGLPPVGGQASQRQDVKTTVLHLKGATFGRDQLIEMFDQIAKQQKDGSRIIVEDR